MTPEGVLRLREDGLAWTDVDDEVVALNARSAIYLGANASAAVLWHELVAGATEQELAARLAATYGLSPEHAHRDTAAFLAELREHGLLDG
jgi:Coenzyme PQQ synthesis protein D (PqqD)